MRSEFLKRCRQRAGESNKSGDKQRTVYQSPAYHRLLGHAERLEDNQIPEELFDGFSVMENLNNGQPIPRTPSDYVSDVLDAVVRMIRRRIAGAVVLCMTLQIVSTEVYTCAGCP